MFSKESSKNDQEERKGLIDRSDKRSNSKDISASAETQTKKAVSERSIASTTSSVASIGRRGPKMSDGTEFDTGPYGWIFSFIYLFILWGLSIAFACCLVYFNLSRLDKQFPTYFGYGTFIGGIPRATFDPNPRRFEETRKNIMMFNMYDFSSYKNYLIRYNQILRQYVADEGKGKTTKKLCKGQALTDTEACKFDRFTDFNDCTLDEENLEHGFGFGKGQPCIMLKVNKIVGWAPDVKKPECKPDNLCCGEGIKFECHSDDNIKFEYYPPQGIPHCYFPYANQPGYEQPFMMAKLSNITIDKDIRINCKPTLESIKHLTDDKENEVHFLLRMKKQSSDENF